MIFEIAIFRIVRHKKIFSLFFMIKKYFLSLDQMPIFIYNKMDIMYNLSKKTVNGKSQEVTK